MKEKERGSFVLVIEIAVPIVCAIAIGVSVLIVIIFVRSKKIKKLQITEKSNVRCHVQTYMNQGIFKSN